MSESVYKIIELTESWEKAATAAIERAAQSLCDLRVAEVVQLDRVIEDGKVTAYRAKIKSRSNTKAVHNFYFDGGRNNVIALSSRNEVKLRLMFSLESFISQFQDKTISVSVYDLETSQEININSDVIMHPASTMKVPVMMEVFHQVHTRMFLLDENIEIHNSFQSIVDQSEFHLDIADDSEKTLYTRIGEKETIRELNRLMIVWSSNLATNILMDTVSAKSIDNFVKELGIRDVNVIRKIEDNKAYRLNMNNSFSARGTTQMMKLIAEGKVISREVCDEMIQVMLGQEFNESIPALLPKDVKVAHKTGWTGEFFHDTGIVIPSNRKPYAITLFTNGFPEDDESQAHNCMTNISKLIYELFIK